ncbi:MULTISPECIES: hypothetical protein [Thalassospira]|jgi:hypothetical protein|nr:MULTISPECIES: hypothetical protein [Thalassospira]MDG4721314.1 hypothetical protein [Thalassospira sp. FZY0004]
MERMEDVTQASMAAWIACGGASLAGGTIGNTSMMDDEIGAASFTYGGGACGVPNADSEIRAAAGSMGLGWQGC